MKKAVEQETLQALVETGAAREFQLLPLAPRVATRASWFPRHGEVGSSANSGKLRS